MNLFKRLQNRRPKPMPSHRKVTRVAPTRPSRSDDPAYLKKGQPATEQRHGDETV